MDAPIYICLSEDDETVTQPCEPAVFSSDKIKRMNAFTSKRFREAFGEASDEDKPPAKKAPQPRAEPAPAPAAAAPTPFAPSPVLDEVDADNEDENDDKVEEREVQEVEKGKNPMSKRWSWTINNWRMDDEFKPDGDSAYTVWAIQRAPTTGMVHAQGYTRFKNKKRFNTVRAWFAKQGFKNAHIAISLGNEKQNRDYCRRDDTRIAGPWEEGDYDDKAGIQGRRSDLELIGDQLKAGKKASDIAKEFTSDFIRYGQGIERAAMYLKPPPPAQRNIEVFVLWGETGTGKTHRVLTNFPGAYCVSPGRDPWGGYDDQDVIFFDEFNYQQWEIERMNKYLDKWQCNLDRRYMDKMAYWTKVFICMNDTPEALYNDKPVMIRDAFRRRIRGRCWNVTERETALSVLVQTLPSF